MRRYLYKTAVLEQPLDSGPHVVHLCLWAYFAVKLFAPERTLERLFGTMFTVHTLIKNKNQLTVRSAKKVLVFASIQPTVEAQCVLNRLSLSLSVRTNIASNRTPFSVP